jgi:hypothetical protein
VCIRFYSRNKGAEKERVTEEDGSVSRISLKREADDIHTSFEPHPSSHVLRKTVPPTVTKHKKTGKRWVGFCEIAVRRAEGVRMKMMKRKHGGFAGNRPVAAGSPAIRM